MSSLLSFLVTIQRLSGDGPRPQPDRARALARSASPQNFKISSIFPSLTVFFQNFHIFFRISRPGNGPLVQYLRGYIKLLRPLVNSVKSLIFLQVRYDH